MQFLFKSHHHHQPHPSISKKGEPRNPIIPPEIIIDILSRLPARSLTRFRSVCKHWLSLIYDPFFIDLYNKHTKPITSLIVSTDFRGSVSFYSLEGILRKPLSLVSIKIETSNCGRSVFHLMAIKTKMEKTLLSCNGLVCFSENCGGVVLPSPMVYVLNPGIGEVRVLPNHSLNRRGEMFTQTVGFGFDCNVKKYKVLRWYCDSWYTSFHMMKYEVFTLGGLSSEFGQWRSIGALPYRCLPSNCCSVNGAVHWVIEPDVMKNCILKFNFGDEGFEVVPFPEGVVWNDMMSLCVLGDCLCLVDRKPEMTIDVWITKDCGSLVWVREYNIHLYQPIFDKLRYVCPIVEDIVDGKVIFRCKRYPVKEYFMSYDRKKETMEELNFTCGDYTELKAYTESLVSIGGRL